MSAVALDAGLPNDAVFHIEKHQRIPRIDTILRLAMTLGVSPAWLTYGEGSPELPHLSLAALNIADRVRFLRLERGLSQAALGRVTHVSGQTIANIETGGMVPKIDTVEYLAAALGVAAGWLAFAGDGDTVATVKNEIVT